MSVPTASEVRLSVVIPCFNGLPHLKEQLDALCNEDPPFEWEVIVADNGSSDGTLDLARRYEKKMALRVVDASAKAGASYARNQGASQARGANLVFVDADDVVAPGYIAAMDKGIQRWGFVAATMDGTFLNPPWAVAARQVVPRAGLVQGLYPQAGAGILGIERKLFEEVDGFDESIPAEEDWDFCWRVQRDTQARLQLCEAVLRCRLRTDPRAMFTQGRSYGRGDASLYKKWATEGMQRAAPRVIGRRWASAIAHLLLGMRSRMHRARGLFLLGLNIGRLEGSIRYKVVYL